MMFKKISYLVLSLLLLASCNVIAPDNRLIDVDVKVGQRRVLLEEFTGFRCVNCPLAAEIAHEMIDLYGDHIIVMSLHPKGSSWTQSAASPGYVDLTSDVATVYYQTYGSPLSFPMGMIDRTPFDGAVLQDRATWMTYVNQELVVDPVIDLAVTAKVDTVDRSIELTSTVTTEQEVSSDVYLQLLIVESHIIGTQLMPDGKENNAYEHNHVLRAAINGDWGEKVSLAAVGSQVELINNYTVPADYVLKNCSVIAFLYHGDTRQVIQAYEVEL